MNIMIYLHIMLASFESEPNLSLNLLLYCLQCTFKSQLLCFLLLNLDLFESCSWQFIVSRSWFFFSLGTLEARQNLGLSNWLLFRGRCYSKKWFSLRLIYNWLFIFYLQHSSNGWKWKCRACTCYFEVPKAKNIV